MYLFADMDQGPQYLFDWIAKTHEPYLPVFSTGCFLTTPFMATLVILLTGFTLARRGHLRSASILTGCYLLGLFMVQGIQLLMRRNPSSFGDTWTDYPGFFTGDLHNRFSSFPSEAMFLSAFAWVSAIFASRLLAWSMSLRVAVMILAALVVLGGFMCHLILSQHYLSDLIAGLVGGVGLALVACSFAFEQPASPPKTPH